MTKVAFFGDPHGNFRPVRNLVKQGGAGHAFLLGDFDLVRPLDEELADLVAVGCDINFVHGNHDADRESWHDFVFASRLASRNLSGTFRTVGNLRVAGLGGVFHEEVWHPRDGNGQPVFSSRTDFLAANFRKAWRGGLPLRHRSTIFPEDFNTLVGLEANVLICHEAPSSHKYGHPEIDDLAEAMGVQLIVHGHVHQDYRAILPNGVRVIGLAKAGLLTADIDDLLDPNWVADAS